MWWRKRQKGTSAKGQVTLRRLQLFLEPLEDRLAPAVTTAFAGGLLTVNLNAASDTATLTGTAVGGANIQVVGTSYGPTNFTGVTRIIIQDPLANDAGQSVILTSVGGNGIIMTSSIAISGVETVTLSTSTALRASQLSVSGATTALNLNTSGVTTTAAAGQVYGNAVVLGGNVTVSAGAGPVTFAGTVNGNAPNRDLIVNTTGTTTFTGAVGSGQALRVLTTGGSTVLNGGSVWTTGNQTYGDAVTLGANTILNARAGAISFNNTLNGAFSLTANSTGNTTFAGLVGSGTALTSLSTNTGGTTRINGGGVTTTGNQTYIDAVTLGANTVINAGSGNVTFASTLNSSGGNRTLMVNSTGTATFAGAVGASSALSSLTTNAGGNTQINANVTTNGVGGQVYGDNVVLGGNVTVNAGAGPVTFAGTVNSVGANRSLVVNSTGATTFGGAVGTSLALSSLTTNAGGTTAINGGTMTTTGAQAYNDAVALGADTTLNAGTGAITFGNTLNGAFNLATTTTGNTTFTGAVGNTTPLNALTVTNANNLSFNSTLATTGDVTQTAGNGTTTLRGASIGGALNLTTNNITLSTAAVTTTGPVGLYARTTITLNAALTSNTGALTLTADTDGNNSGTVTSNSSGDITAAAAGANVTISGADAMNLAGAIATSGGQVSITNTDNSGGTITRSSDPLTTAGGQVVLKAPDGITLSAANADVSTGGGSFTVNADTDADGTGTYSQSNSGSAVTTSGGAIAITADDINLAGTINSGTGSVTILSSNAQTIGLGATAGGMTISGTELGRITAGDLTIGNGVNTSITVNGITAAQSNNISGMVTLVSTRGVAASDITFATGASTFNALTAIASDTIAVNIGLTADSGGLILTADSDGDGVGAVTSTAAGDITLTAAAAALVISGADAMNLAGAIATTGGQVSITNTDNSGGTITRSSDPLTTSGGQVVLNAPDGITLSAANADVTTGSGSFTVNADTDADGTGTYSQSNAGSAVTTSGGAVAITADEINLAGTINSGTGSATILSSNAQTIGLGATAGGMTISGTELQNITATGLTIGNAVNLSITVDAITAANSNNISGTVTLNATGTGQDVNFGVGPSVFNTLVANADNNINVTGAVTTDIGGLGLTAASGTVNLGANITTASGATATISAGAGASQTAGALTATNLLLLGGGTFSLNQAGNDLATLAADLNAGSLSVTDADDLTVGTVSGVVGIATGLPAPGGGVTLTATNGLTINQAINTTAGSGGNVNISNDVMVNAALTAGAGNITLDGGTGSGNDVVVNLGGSVTTSGGGTITINSPDMLLLVGLLDAPAASIDLTAGGGIFSLGGNVITADLNLSSGPFGIVLDTDVATLTALATNSDITIRQSNGLALNAVDAGTGNVSLFLAAGALVDNNGAAANLTGNILSLLALAGIGTAADVLETNVNFLEADGGSGGVYLANAQSLTIILTGVVATAGDIDLGSVGALTVDANVLTPGNIILTANESLPGAAGDDLRVNSALVRAGGSATFQTGDGLNFTFGSTIQAGISITVRADVGNNDPLGSLITVAGTMLAPRLDLFCGPDTDLVTIFPSAATPIYAHGGDPGGNALFVDLTGISSAALTLYTPTSGLWTFDNRQLLWFVDFIAAWNPDANVIVVDDDEENDSLLFSWPILGYFWGSFGIGLTVPTTLAVGGATEAGGLGTSSPFSLLPASQAGFTDPSKLDPQARETISGIVFLDNNQDGLPGRGETRLAGAVLVLERLEGGVWVPVTSTRSGSNGEFIFFGLRPSQFRIRASSDGQRGLDNLTIQTHGSGGIRVHSATSTSFDGAISHFQPDGKLPSQEILDRIFSAWGQADQDLDTTSATEVLATADNMLDNAWTPLAAAGALGVASLSWDRYFSRRRRLSVPAPGNNGNNDD